MQDCLKELEETLAKYNLDYENILYASILYIDDDVRIRALLPPKWLPVDLDCFKSQLSRIGEYDNTHNSPQNLFGMVVFNNSGWLERWEYDGEEGWDYKKMPTWKEVRDAG